MFSVRLTSMKATVGLALVMLFSITITATGQSLYLIHHGPLKGGSPRVPNVAIIYQFDEDTGELTLVWPTGVDVEAFTVEVYPDPGPIVITQGEWSFERLYVFWRDNIRTPEFIKLEAPGSVSKYRYVPMPDGTSQMEIKYFDGTNNNSSDRDRTFGYTLVPLAGSPEAHVDTGARELWEPRVAGSTSIISFRRDPSSVLTPIGTAFAFDEFSILDSVVTSETSRGWNLILNEPSHRCLLSVPDRHGLTHRELLVQDRATGTWQSVMIEGSRTTPRPINGWLVGTIADTDPETDYEARKGFPSLLREEAVVFDPLTCHQFTVHLGKMSEVLWIEDSTLYFRTGQELHRARIDNDALVDATLLISDFKVNFIHWAFRASSE